MFSLLLFFLDFFLYALLDQWVFYLLLIYFVTLLVSELAFSKRSLLTLFLLLVQDHFLYGRFGLGLVCLLPVVGLAATMRSVFHRHYMIFSQYLLLITFFVLDHFLIEKWLFTSGLGGKSTMIKISINLIVLSLTFLGRRGNRFLPR
ncbi:hypothetical protein KAT92_02515, partial [Candidatus Babeliales bacterium]|nr:hypothetical protein [Candidatus Babeliales bacterium]